MTSFGKSIIAYTAVALHYLPLVITLSGRMISCGWGGEGWQTSLETKFSFQTGLIIK